MPALWTPSGKKSHDKPLPNDEQHPRTVFAQLRRHGRVLVVVDQPASIATLPVAVARADGCQVAYRNRQPAPPLSPKTGLVLGHPCCQPEAMPDSTFYSDRTGRPAPRVGEEISTNAWRGFVALIQTRLRDGSLARAFPKHDCPDGTGYLTGTDEGMFFNSLKAHVPGLADTALDPNQLPSTPIALDIVDFVARHIDQPTGKDFHPHCRNEHIFFADHDADRWNDIRLTPGQAQFQKDVELLLARNGIAFSLGDDLRVRRLGPPEARQLISDFKPKTGDPQLDAKLNDAMFRFQSRTPADIQDALEKLWDAFERLKTLEPGVDKKDSVTKLLNEAAPDPFRAELESDFNTLTRIGNKFTIRHHERDKDELPNDDSRDYMFTRLAGLIGFVLRRTGRMGP